MRFRRLYPRNNIKLDKFWIRFFLGVEASGEIEQLRTMTRLLVTRCILIVDKNYARWWTMIARSFNDRIAKTYYSLIL